MVTLPLPPTREELETAQTLVNLHRGGPPQDTSPYIAAPSSFQGPSVSDTADAMDKVTGQYDAQIPGRPLNRDAMDSVIGLDELLLPTNSALNVETGRKAENSDALFVETEPDQPPNNNTMTANTQYETMHVETPLLKELTIKLRCLEDIVMPEKSKKKDLEASDLPAGEHFTHSRSTPAPPRKGRKPQSASTGISYDDTPSQEEFEDKPNVSKGSKPVFKPSKHGPSEQRQRAQSMSTQQPEVQLPPVPSTHTSEDSEQTEIDENAQSTTPTPAVPSKDKPKGNRGKGQLVVTEHELKKSTNTQKYRCRMCRAGVNSSHELRTHHQQQHGIMYCTKCQKAFNNQLSLARHMYEHKTRPHQCPICGKSFPFESQLKTHCITHIERCKHHCAHPKCNKHFKNKGDLTRHAKEHSSQWYTCPDCPEYRTKDKRNFESHHSKHSQIEKYWCESCGKGFVYNTQKQRHVKQKACKQ